jgi:2-hydroxychromene-2-carboxylate isomerase
MPTASLVEQPVFYYDLGSPDCYLAAERIMTALPVVPEWEPVLGSALVGREPQPPRERIETLARQLRIQPVRWPERWPPDTLMAMRAATYAKRIGRAVAFSLAGFRQAFAGGRDLGEQDTVLIAGAACEMHPSALLKGVALRSVIEGLEQATERARAAGVSALPAIEIDGSLLQGERAVEDAATELLRLGSTR